MQHPTTTPQLDEFLQNLDKDAQTNGYPAGIVLNMKHDPAMLDILARMVRAEIKTAKEKRKARGCELCEASSPTIS